MPADLAWISSNSGSQAHARATHSTLTQVTVVQPNGNARAARVVQGLPPKPPFEPKVKPTSARLPIGALCSNDPQICIHSETAIVDVLVAHVVIIGAPTNRVAEIAWLVCWVLHPNSKFEGSTKHQKSNESKCAKCCRHGTQTGRGLFPSDRM